MTQRSLRTHSSHSLPQTVTRALPDLPASSCPPPRSALLCTRCIGSSGAGGRPKGGIGFRNPSGPNPLSLKSRFFLNFQKNENTQRNYVIFTGRGRVYVGGTCLCPSTRVLTGRWCRFGAESGAGRRCPRPTMTCRHVYERGLMWATERGREMKRLEYSFAQLNVSAPKSTHLVAYGWVVEEVGAE
jgi:hypothetical protein